MAKTLLMIMIQHNFICTLKADLHAKTLSHNDKLTVGLWHELFLENQTYNSLQLVVSLLYARKSYHVNRPLIK